LASVLSIFFEKRFLSLKNKELGDGFWGFCGSGARIDVGIERDWMGSAGQD
jgi:hypothetical protein